MSRLTHFLDNRLTNSGEVVSLTRRRKIPGTHFCWRLSRPQGYSAAGKIRSNEKSHDFTENRTRHLPACSIMHQPLRYRVPKYLKKYFRNIQLRSHWPLGVGHILYSTAQKLGSKVRISLKA
jgi:hypothetical protein